MTAPGGQSSRSGCLDALWGLFMFFVGLFGLLFLMSALTMAIFGRAGIAFSYTGIGFFFTWCYYRRLLGPSSK